MELGKDELTAMEEADRKIKSAISILQQTREGRFFLTWLLDIGRFGENPFIAKGISPEFIGGEMNVGMKVFSYVFEVSPEDYIKGIKEYQDVKRTTRNTDTANSSGHAVPRDETA